MSDPTANTSPQEPQQPAAPAAEDEFAPPDDFGASVLAEFAKREAGSNGDNGAAPPGGWPADTDSKNLPAQQPTQPAPSPGEGAPASAGEADAGGAATSPATTSPAATPPAAPTATPATPDTTTPPAGADQSGGSQPATPGDTPDGTESAAPSGYTYRYNDGTADRELHIPDTEVEQALSIAAWAQQLPDATRQSIAAIESGQAVAIPRATYDQFVAWQNQQTRATRDADLADLDPDVAKLLADQRDQIAQLTAQQQQTQQQLPPQEEQRVHAALAADAQRIGAVQAEYAQSRGLSAQEVEGLMNYAVRAEIIPHLMERRSVYNPVTGAMLRPADIGQVAQEALDFALLQDPALHSRVLSGQQPTPAVPGAPATPAVDPVAQKRARAASLATAPSGAPAPAPADVKTMAPTDIVAAMARDIEAAIAGK